jgi:spore germination protein YaaH
VGQRFVVSIFHLPGDRWIQPCVLVEDEKSIPLKSRLAMTHKLAGVSVFSLGYDDLSSRQALRAGGL